MRKDDARFLTPSAQEALRRRVVKAIGRGMSQSEAGRVFGVSRQSINSWLRQFRTR
ncbi:MAG: helix-turn-helix domain-containing protein, partial [candidate division WOR-3 bacterium]|nr:helix-turn-helix domain-containing protein [candidate division WOR-3 bacterium]